MSVSPKSRGLQYKFLLVYILMFVLPGLYLMWVIWDLVRRLELEGSPVSLAALSLTIGVPAAVVLSIAAFSLMYRSLARLAETTRSAAAIMAEMHPGEEGALPAAEAGDEAEMISSYVTDMIGELRKRLGDVDQYAKDLHQANKRLVEMAVNDGLTGLYNQKHVKHVLATELDRAIRYKHQLSVLMLDVDNFKAFNDAYGHVQGDKALKDVSLMIRENIRRVDVASRYGGEEFLIIVPETSLAEAKAVAERIRKAVEKHPFDAGQAVKPGRLSISIGVSAYLGNPVTDQELISLADARLYEAKRAGKNRVAA